MSKVATAIYIAASTIVTLGLYLYKFQRPVLEAYPIAEWTLSITAIVMFVCTTINLFKRKPPSR